MNQSIDQLSQKLDANIKEARTPTDAEKAIDIATRHREEIRQKMQSNALSDEEKRLYENADNELAGIIADVQKGRTEIHEKTEVAQWDLKQTVTATPAKVVPTVDDATMRSEMAEYQAEAKNAIRNLLVKNGQIDENAIKQAVKLADDLAHLRLDETQFAELEETERDILKQQMPAVQGMIGAVFVESLFANGYDIRFNGSGTVDIGKKMGENEVKLAPTQDMQMILNSYIGQNPSFLSMLKAGLLFHSGDINQYLNKISDTNGNPQNEQDTTFASFSSYLRNRPTQADTSAGKAIMNSQGMFSDSEFRSYLEAAKYVPALTNSMQAISNNPDLVNAVAATGVSMANVPQNGNNAINNSANNLSVPNFWERKDIPTFAQSLREKGIIGGVLEQIGASYGHMFNTIGSSPAAATGALIAFIASGFFFGWKNTFKTAFFWIPAVIFGWNALESGWKSIKGDLPKANPDTTPLPPPNPAVVAAIQEEAHGDKAQENAKITDKFLTATVADVNAYLTDKSGNLTDEQKAILDNPEQAAAVKKEYEVTLNKLKEKTNDPAIADNPEIQKLLNESVNGYTLEYLRQLVSLTPEQTRDKLAGELEKRANDPSLPPEARETFKQLLEQVKSGALTAAEGLTVLACIGVGLVGLLTIIWAIAKVKFWKNIWDLAKRGVDNLTGKPSSSSSSVSRGGVDDLWNTSNWTDVKAKPSNKFTPENAALKINQAALNRINLWLSPVKYAEQIDDSVLDFKSNETITARNQRLAELKYDLTQKNTKIDTILQTEINKQLGTLSFKEKSAVRQAYTDLKTNNQRLIDMIDKQVALDISSARPFENKDARQKPDKDLVKKQEELRNAKKSQRQWIMDDIENMRKAMNEHKVGYKVNGKEILLTHNDAKELDSLIRDISQYDGRKGVDEATARQVISKIQQMETVLSRSVDATTKQPLSWGPNIKLLDSNMNDVFDGASKNVGGFLKKNEVGSWTIDVSHVLAKLSR